MACEGDGAFEEAKSKGPKWRGWGWWWWGGGIKMIAKYKHIDKQGAQHPARIYLNCSRLDSFCGICLALYFKW